MNWKYSHQYDFWFNLDKFSRVHIQRRTDDMYCLEMDSMNGSEGFVIGIYESKLEAEDALSEILGIYLPSFDPRKSKL